ncbi:uncharacterized protein [Gossypium hirsutum]|uniref:Retrotransposon gag domain-containing protein n=1 Tax=Gossypium hirsutum TaxID=3635 RepID=A0ABM3ABC4_GOSHI|nr:uncharacterized protein LOC121218384 [Gossypium hirsutum]
MALHQSRSRNSAIEMKDPAGDEGSNARVLEKHAGVTEQHDEPANIAVEGGSDKGKGPMGDSGDDNEDSTYPPRFAPVSAQPPKMSVNIRPQYQSGTSALGNLPTGSSSNPDDNLEKPTVPDLDDVEEKEKARAELLKQFEDRCKWLEERFKALEGTNYYCGVDAKELSLVPDLVLSPKLKMPEFERYNGTSCPEAHITMFCRRMTGYVNNDQLLIHCFQDNLIGAAAKWYNQLSCTQIKSWKDLAQAFMEQYGHVTDIAPDKITLQNMEKKSGESFRKYAQRWREVAIQVQPPLLEKETTILFINTLKAPFINHMLGSATKSFTDIVMSGEMIENAIRCGKIETGESTRRSAPKKRENEVGNVSSGYSKPVTVNQSRTIATGQQAAPRREPNTRQNTERFQFTPIPVTYRELYKKLFDAHCEYHAGIIGHSIENCTSFKKCVERLIKAGVVKFDDTPGTENPLPSHTDKGVNAIIENMGRKVKLNIADVRTPLKLVWKEMQKRGLVPQELRDKIQDTRNYCEFHHEKDHEIQNCIEFRALVHGLMDNKELEFLESIEEKDVCSPGGESSEEGCRASRPVIIISKPRVSEVEARVTPRVIIQKPTVSPYKDSHRVPWNYNCSIAVTEKEGSINTPNTEVEPAKGKPVMLKQEVERLEPLVNEPVMENEAKEFLKFLRHTGYSVVEQLHQ